MDATAVESFWNIPKGVGRAVAEAVNGELAESFHTRCVVRDRIVDSLDVVREMLGRLIPIPSSWHARLIRQS